MSHRLLTVTLLAALLSLAGCGGNYKSSDGDYRPLGDSQDERRAD
ncbi:type VI secretion protein [Pseudomonas sp. BMS12]|nr:type VI secretion protein [Pseudomonas sp. BMS12]